MKEYNFKDSVVEFFKRVYERVNVDYRLARFDAMAESGELEGMCSSEVHRRFHISGEF
ncbi:hypothetical protein HOE04_02890 [archaeon]|nr:hypothetical protein [archaeon]